MTFSLDEKQQQKLKKWMDGRNPEMYAGASGGRWTFAFTPTSIGTVVVVRDAMLDKAELDLSDYEDW